MACAGDKTKLIIIGTKKLRAAKLNEPEQDIKIRVCGNVIRSSESEKLLGITVNNELTWRHHLYGEKWRIPEKENLPGLLVQLSQRVGMLKQLVRLVPKQKFKMLSDGIFNSKVIYCLQVFGQVWGFGYDETQRRSAGFTKEDNRRLQVLQNKVCRLKTGLSYDTFTENLLKLSRDLSIHQLTAYHTILTVQKIKSSHKPAYLDSRMKFNTNEDVEGHGRQVNKIYIDQRLSIARGGFVYRGALLWNQLPERLRTLANTNMFKKEARGWVQSNVKIKPG